MASPSQGFAIIRLFFSCQHIFFSEVPAIYDGTRLLVYRLLPKSIPDQGLKVNFEYPFLSLSNVITWFNIILEGEDFCNYSCWGSRGRGGCSQRELHPRLLTSPGSQLFALPLPDIYINWESHKWIIGQQPIKKISIAFFVKNHVI